MGKIGSKVDDPVHKPDIYQIHHLLDDVIIIRDVKPRHRDVVSKALRRYISPKAAIKKQKTYDQLVKLAGKAAYKATKKTKKY
jgi:hypothetical protein